jgi:hypothetical protein
MSVPLIDLILRLLGDKKALEEFQNNPHGVLTDAGLGDLCGVDVAQAAPLVLDKQSVQPRGDGSDNGAAAATPPVHPGPGETEIDVAIKHIQHITKHYVSNDNDTVDNSVNQSIWNSGELDLHQVFDNDPTVANGDGSLAAGDDIEGTITTGNNNTVVSGDDNVVGDGNAVGEGNLVNNGNNNATGDGNVTGSFGDGATVATNSSLADSSTNGSYNTDNSTDVDVDVEESFNDNSDNRQIDNSDHSDHSVEVKDSFTIEDSGNTTTEIEESFNDNEVDISAPAPVVP